MGWREGFEKIVGNRVILQANQKVGDNLQWRVVQLQFEFHLVARPFADGLTDLCIEWHHKPIAISTVSDGVFGGSQVITSIQFSLWKIRAWTVTAMFPVPKVVDTFDENGVPKDKEAMDKRAAGFTQ